jgi:hypothetical protein
MARTLIFSIRLSYAFALVIISGCMTANVQQSRHTLTGLEDNEFVAVIARSFYNGNNTEAKFIDCIDKRLSAGKNPVNVMHGNLFRDTFYPWFEPRTAPQSAADLPRLLADPAIENKIRETGLRYIIWIEGSTEALEGGGTINCAVGPGAGGCFGLMWWEKDSDYEASIWDVKNVSSAGQISTDVNGMSVMPAVVVPIPLIAPTQNTACKRMASQLQRFLILEDG